MNTDEHRVRAARAVTAEAQRCGGSLRGCVGGRHADSEALQGFICFVVHIWARMFRCFDQCRNATFWFESKKTKRCCRAPNDGGVSISEISNQWRNCGGRIGHRRAVITCPPKKHTKITSSPRAQIRWRIGVGEKLHQGRNCGWPHEPQSLAPAFAQHRVGITRQFGKPWYCWPCPRTKHFKNQHRALGPVDAITHYSSDRYPTPSSRDFKAKEILTQGGRFVFQPLQRKGKRVGADFGNRVRRREAMRRLKPLTQSLAVVSGLMVTAGEEVDSHGGHASNQKHQPFMPLSHAKRMMEVSHG